MKFAPFAAVLVLTLLVAPSQPAAGAATGPCVIIMQGQDASAGAVAIDVPESGEVSYHIESPVPVVRWTVALHYGPFTIPALDQRFPADSTLVREGTTSVKDFTKYGTGRYEVTGDAELSDGTHCTARLDMIVPGSPLTSVLGIAALALFGAGVVALLALVIQVLLSVNDVRVAIRDFVVQARVTRDEAAKPLHQGPPDNAAVADDGVRHDPERPKS